MRGGGGERIKIVKLQLEAPTLWFEEGDKATSKAHKWRWRPNNALSTYYLFFGFAYCLNRGIQILVSNQNVMQVTLLDGNCAISSSSRIDTSSAHTIYYNAMLYTTAEALYTGDMQLGISTDAEGTDMAVSEAVYGYYKPRT